MKPDDRTLGEKVADKVAAFGGSWHFILSAIAVITAWISYNLLAAPSWQFDSHPFILLNLVLSLIAAFQAPFILMSQGRAEKKAEKAHRRTLRGIKRLVKQDIQMEEEILILLKNQNKDIENEILDILRGEQRCRAGTGDRTQAS